eukprot:TRINITY_DN330_c1_g1_i2.p1 TRINITY_DN330_c1_g1~~TRINITY_DN330_c1_g1_i2.p1  ORF type:complete len:342 (-),score=122.30 TRINITY_DN330_c1_g1_i2:135-1160(-)
MYQQLVENEVDDRLAKHIAHLFIRDPLVIFEELIHQDNTMSSDHFENIQSTNWQTVRWKPPPPNSNIGWRTEFRPMEVQLTEFENAAFPIFIALLARSLVLFRHNLYVPLSKVEENMKRAHKKDAVLEQKFYWRVNVKTPQKPVKTESLEKEEGDMTEGDTSQADEDHVEKYLCESPDVQELSIHEIINGKEGTEWHGLIDLVRGYLKCHEERFPDTEEITLNKIDTYLDFVSDRASGELMTMAHWLREQATNHPDYKNDSVITQQIEYDILQLCHDVRKGDKEAHELLGVYWNGEVKMDAAQLTKDLLNFKGNASVTMLTGACCCQPESNEGAAESDQEE